MNQKNVDLEVWVVFNPIKPSIDFTAWPKWIHFELSKKGVNSARNVGLSKSSRDLVLFLDSDCEIVDANHIEKLAYFLESKPQASGAGGGYQTAKAANTTTLAYNYLQMQWLRQQIVGSDFSSQALIGGHMLLKKSKIGSEKFDENIIFGGAEKEFFVRLGQQSHLFYVDLNLNVLHTSEISRKDLLKKAKAQGEGDFYIKSRNPGLMSARTTYFVKPYFDSSWSEDINSYQSEFSKYSKQGSKKVNFIKKFVYSMIEHLMISQSSRD